MVRYLLYLMRSGLGIPDYWHPYLQIQDDFAGGHVARYPISMSAKGDYPGALNAEGVPVISDGNGLMTTPVIVALYGLGSSDLFLGTKNERYRRQLGIALNWLETHRVPLGEGIGWPHEHEIEAYNIHAPWFSCVTQGLALSLFVRAYKLEQLERWRDRAFQTYLGFQVPLARGGFAREVNEGLIYEEYPTPEMNFVFNGMCWALIGLWEASCSGLVREAEHEFRRGVSALRSYLPRFDYDGWTLYSLSQRLGRPYLASPYYLRANGLLAQVIGLMANEPQFNAYGQRWISTSKSLMRRIRMSLRICLDRAPYGLFRPRPDVDN